TGGSIAPPFSLGRPQMGRLATALGFLLLASAGVALSGCGDRSDGRRAVSGTVLFKGKPLDQGRILFLPLSKGLATQSGAGITNGTYEIPRAQGLVPGRYRVSISSGDGKTPDGPTGALPGPSGNFSSKEQIPPQYNLDSKLEVEVKSDGPNKFDF